MTAVPTSRTGLREIVLKLIVAGEVQYRANVHHAYKSACKTSRRDAAHAREAGVPRQPDLSAKRPQADASCGAKRYSKWLLTIVPLRYSCIRQRRSRDARSRAAGTGLGRNWAAWALEIAKPIDPVSRLQIGDEWNGRTIKNRRLNSRPHASVPTAEGVKMLDDDRLRDIKHLLFNYARSPSLRLIRDPHTTITVLANEIMRVVNVPQFALAQNGIRQREALTKSAVGCWIPLEDLRGS